MALRTVLTDADWAMIKEELPPPKRTGRPRKDERLVLEGILWILRTGAPWRDLPTEFGPWQTVYHVFNKWRKEGVLTRIKRRLYERLKETGRLHKELWCVDGTIVRAHRSAAGAKKRGPERGGATKR